MKVLLLTNFFYPEKTGIAVTATDNARFIKELGHEAAVVTTMPYYPEWEIPKEYRGKLFAKEMIHDIPVTRVWQYVPKAPSTIKRIIHEATGAINSFVAALCHKADAVMCISPPLPLGYIAMLVAKLKRVPYWCYVQDIQPDAAIELGMLKNPFARKLSFWLERKMYAGADKILVLSEGMRQNLLGKGLQPEKVSIIPIAVDCKELDVEGDPQHIFRKRYNLQDKFLILYSGNLGIKHNVEIIAHAAHALRDRGDIYFAVVGDGAARASLQALIKEYDLKNIDLYPLCEREELADMLASADVLLAPQRKEVKDIAIPSKLLSYLGSGTPVIASALKESESGKLLSEHSAGIVVEPEQVVQLTEAILKLQSDPTEALECGRRGKMAVRQLFDRERVKESYYKPLLEQ